MSRVAPRLTAHCLFLVLALVACPTPARAWQGEGSAPSPKRADTLSMTWRNPIAVQAGADTLRKITPGGAWLRSTVLPGWGQVYAGRPLKGIAVGLTEAWFVRLLVRASGEVKDLVAIRDSTPAGPARLAIENELELWRSERRRWIGWVLGTWIFAMVDAYVDAHLFYFDMEEPDFGVPGIGMRTDPIGFRLGIRIPLERNRHR
jgi:hypothetical protein